MATREYSIGRFRFLGIQGQLQTPNPKSEVITRPGLAGGEIWRTKPQPVPFTVRSLVDCNSIAEAQQTYMQYQMLPYAERLIQAVWADSASSNLRTSYYVQNVTIVGIQAILAHEGKRISSLSKALLECEWTLIPFDDAAR